MSLGLERRKWNVDTTGLALLEYCGPPTELTHSGTNSGSHSLIHGSPSLIHERKIHYLATPTNHRGTNPGVDPLYISPSSQFFADRDATLSTAHTVQKTRHLPLPQTRRSTPDVENGESPMDCLHFSPGGENVEDRGVRISRHLATMPKWKVHPQRELPRNREEGRT